MVNNLAFHNTRKNEKNKNQPIQTVLGEKCGTEIGTHTLKSKNNCILECFWCST